MKIVVFGSTGGVGQEVVQNALFNGHTVTAFLRSPEKLQTSPGVTIASIQLADIQVFPPGNFWLLQSVGG